MQLPVAEVTRYIHRVGRTVLLACHFVASLWSHVVPVFWCLPMLPWVFILPALLSQKGNGSHSHGMIVMRLSQTFTLARKENSWTYSFTCGHVFFKSTENAKCPSCIFVAAPVYHSCTGDTSWYRAMARTLCVLVHANGEGLRNATLQGYHRLYL